MASIARKGIIALFVGLLIAATCIAALPEISPDATPDLAAEAWFAESTLGHQMSLRFSGERDVVSRRLGRTAVETLHLSDRDPLRLLRTARGVENAPASPSVPRFLLLLQLRR
jgi:hypothetical protein